MKKSTSAVWAVVCLLVVSSASASVVIVPDRLSLDGLFWFNGSWSQTTSLGYQATSYRFYSRGVRVSLDGRVTSTAAVRAEYDVAISSPLDLYAEFGWSTGLTLRAGQFKPPLGLEACSDPAELKLIEYSNLSRYWKPATPRDIGVMIGYTLGRMGASVAVVNGNGRNQLSDDNQNKDIAARVTARPFAALPMDLGVRGYYGRTGEIASLYQILGADIRGGVGPLLMQAEYLYVGFRGGEELYVRNGVYVMASYGGFGFLEPVLRLQFEDQLDGLYDYGATAGLNFRIRGDALKVMVNYDFWQKASDSPENEQTVQGFLAQLQARI